jgi:purine nucleoside permease
MGKLSEPVAFPRRKNQFACGAGLDQLRAMTRAWLFLVSFILISTASTAAVEAVLQPKVVIVAMFEPGQDTGDAPGEFQFWVEREKLEKIYPLPSAYHDVRANADGSVIGIVTGVGATRAAATIMALGSDPRFDLRKTYWLVAGIAGINPAQGSLGSAAWAEWLVDGSLAHQIDSREMPADWPTGYVPLDRKKPYELPRDTNDTGQVFHLDPGLVNWAFALTKDVKLEDTMLIRKRREDFVGFPNAQRPPFVLKGDNLTTSTYWHGKLLNAWADAWVKYYTDGRGNYATTAMEDTGTAQALTWLTRAGKADVRRLLVLRTASNFDMQWPGGTAEESLFGEKLSHYSSYIPSLEAAHRVGSVVVHELVNGWKQYEDNPPQSK